MISTRGGSSDHGLRALFERGTVAGCDDDQLLNRFAADRRDEAAFAALVARHGPMVLATARAVLRHEQDAEDAFQATFLTLARKARSVRGGASLAAWLHRVAYRSAVEASQATRRRRAVERALLPAAPTTGPSAEPDLAAVVRAEVERLPAVNRLPVILCDLEGFSYLEAARQLGWTEPTLRNRLVQARSRLKTRLARRGYADLATPLAWGSTPARAVVSTALTRTTLALALGRTTASTTVLSLAQLSAKGFLMHHWKLITAALLAASTIGAVGSARATRPETAAPAVLAAPLDADQAPPPGDTAVVRGRVIDPTGQPVAGAQVWTNGNFNHPGPRTKVATGPDGGFAFPAPARFRQAEPMSSFRCLIAAAPGFGPGWTVDTERPDIVIRLVPAGLPIEGRLIDAQSRPVVGATVEVRNLLAPVNQTSRTESGSLAAYLAMPADSPLTDGVQSLWWDLPGAIATDADGRFRVADIGVERVAVLIVKGSTVATTTLHATTRPGQGVQAVREDRMTSVPYSFRPARFEQLIPPTRPITGVITDTAAGRPLAGWRVQGSAAGDPGDVRDDVEASSDAQGRYSLIGLAVAKSYRLSFTPPIGQPYLPAGFRKVEAPAGDGPVTQDLAARRGVVVRGRVTERQTGAPVTGSLNALAFRSNPHLGDFAGYAESQSYMLVYRYTDAEGRYEVVVPPGPGIIGFRANDGGRYRGGQGAEAIAGLDPKWKWFPTVGREMFPRNYHVLAGVDPRPETEALTLDLQVDADRSIDLAVEDPEGRPLGGVEVDGLDDFVGSVFRWQESATVPLRAFAPGSSRRVTVRHPGRKLVGSMIVSANAASPQTLRLTPWGEVRGRVVGDDGQPRPYIGLRAGGSDPTGHPTPEPSGVLPGGDMGYGIAGDPQGQFHVVGLVPGLHYAATAVDRDGGGIGGLFDDLTILAGEVKDLGDLKVRPFPPRPAEAPARP